MAKLSPYAEKLCEAAKKRYLEKLELTDSVDPFLLSNPEEVNYCYTVDSGYQAHSVM